MRSFILALMLAGVALLLITAEGCDPGPGTWRVDTAAIPPVPEEVIQ